MELAYEEIKEKLQGDIVYKFVKNNKNHNGHVYDLGLNIDNIPFLPDSTCKPGGLYFADAKNIHKFMGYGELLAAIKILPGARFYLDPSGDKYKSDKFEIIEFIDLQNIDCLQNKQSFIKNLAVIKIQKCSNIHKIMKSLKINNK